MAKYRKNTSKTRSITIGFLNILKETCTFLFSIVIGIIELIGTIVE